MKTKILTGAAALLLSASGFSQDLIVQYNYMQDQFRFFRVETQANGTVKKEEITRPVVKRNYQVKLEVVNYNPFLFTVKPDFTQSEVVETPSNGLAGILPGMGGGLPIGAAGLLKNLKLPGLEKPEPSRSRDFLKESGAVMNYQKCKEYYSTLYDISTKLNAVDFATTRLNDMRYNPFMEPDSIKSFSNQLMYNIFEHSTQGTSEFINEINNTTSEYNNAMAGFSNNYKILADLYEKYAADNAGSNYSGKAAMDLAAEMNADVKMLSDSVKTKSIAKRMSDLEQIYRTISNTPFRFNTSTRAKKDEMVVKLDIYENSRYMRGAGFTGFMNTDRLDTLKKVRTKSVEVSVAGDVKVAYSLGMAFPTFFSSGGDYSNRDSVIAKSDGGNYIPNVSTMLTFYPYNGRNASLGGTFGASVPLDDDKSLNYLVGLSGILGNSNKIIISAGITIGKVNKLRTGYQVGDRLENSYADVPVDRKYNVGAFFGVSFGLGTIGDNSSN